MGDWGDIELIEDPQGRLKKGMYARFKDWPSQEASVWIMGFSAMSGLWTRDNGKAPCESGHSDAVYDPGRLKAYVCFICPS